MKRSITARIFITVLIVFLLVLLLQGVFLNFFFNDFYHSRMLSNIQNEFSRSTKGFSGGDEETSDASLRQYTLKTGSPVLVFTEDYKLADRELMNSMNIVTIRLSGGELVKVPTDYLWNFLDHPTALLNTGRHVELWAVQVGSSNFYEPLVLSVGGNPYSSRQNVRDYRIDGLDIPQLHDIGTVQRLRYVYQANSIESVYAEMIYERVKPCLILRQDIGKFLEEACADEFTDESGIRYRLFSESRKVNGTTYYFVALSRLLFSGNEGQYFNQIFYLVYAILGVLLAIAAYFLSRRLSKPMVHLSGVTRQIASLDFSRSADIQGEDELEQLSKNINLMSESLEKAMDELRSSAEKSRENEDRMKLLLDDLSHEFKTPLGIIALYTEVIEKERYEKDKSYYFGVIEHEIERLTDMVNEVIELSKLTSGIWKIELRAAGLNDVINDALGRFSEQLEREGFRVNLSLTDEQVIMDERRMSQVFSNLISNAVKYSGEQKIIDIFAQPEGDHVLVSIRNDGHVSENDMERIWERYYRAAEDRPARLPSQGIGLEIVRSILQKHRSEFGVRSEGGKICFYFTLPRAGDGDEAVS